MGNKITQAAAALETALAGLITDGVLKDVCGRILDPFTEPKRPAVGIEVDHLEPTHGPLGERTWEAVLALQILADQGTGRPSETALNLLSKVQPAFDAAIAAGAATNGGAAYRGWRWDLWYSKRKDEPLAPVGMIGTVTVTVQEPLAT